LEISDAGFHVGFLCAAFFAPRDDSVERVSHTTKSECHLFTWLFALESSGLLHAIAKEQMPDASLRFAKLVPVIDEAHRKPSRYS
jgi:hypothetical protein